MSRTSRIDSRMRCPRNHAVFILQRSIRWIWWVDIPFLLAHIRWMICSHRCSGRWDDGRCIAPDLIGMGDSDKLPDSGPGSYRFVEHRRYLDALLEALGVHERVTLVVHDWGSALGFDWANRHREDLKGIAFMEAIVAPQGRDHWDKMGMRTALEALRSEAGEAMVLQNNYFIEEILPNAILRKLSDEEMAEYRRPFAEPGEERRPTLTWPRQIPIEGEPADVHAIATEYADWLGTSNVPKLFLKADPGAILANDTLVNLVRGWPALTEKTVAGIHFVQEDSPDEIGRAIAGWMGDLQRSQQQHSVRRQAR
jgi:haloalkane dehalogenase